VLYELPLGVDVEALGPDDDADSLLSSTADD
jgi:hypothetical protein